LPAHKGILRNYSNANILHFSLHLLSCNSIVILPVKYQFYLENEIPQVCAKDGLPQTICEDCASKLDAFCRFREVARQSEKSFQPTLPSLDSDKSDSDGSTSKISRKDQGK